MEFKIVDDFLSKEELEKLDNRDFSEDIREAEKNGTIVVSEGPWEETVKAVKAKLARFEAYLFNDTGKYAPEPSDGIAWNNDTGVKMTVRNVQVLTDRPAR